jgi:signal transduction histidine kinase
MNVRQDAERALLVSDQRKDEFLATLAHELRNPLAPLRNALEILKYSAEGSKDSLALARSWSASSGSSCDLVDDLLDVSRITTGKLVLKREEVLFDDIIQSALDATAVYFETRDVGLTVTLPPGAGVAPRGSDAPRPGLPQPPPQRREVHRSGGRVTLDARRERDELIVIVADTGSGFSESKMPLIFEMFAQVDQRLERTYSASASDSRWRGDWWSSMGGRIEVASDGLGKGTRFTVRFPPGAGRRRLHPRRRPRMERSGPRGPRGRRWPGERRRARAAPILLADDNEDFIESFATMLRDMGHQVHCAADGAEALEMVSAIRPEIALSWTSGSRS